MSRKGASGTLRTAWVAATLAGSAAVLGLAVTGFAGAGTGGAGGEPAPAAFRLEDGSVGCRLLSADAVACRAAGADAAVLLRASGESSASDVEVAWDDSTPVLQAAESWWNGAFSCGVEDGAVTCTAGDGAATAAPGGLGGVR